LVLRRGAPASETGVETCNTEGADWNACLGEVVPAMEVPTAPASAARHLKQSTTKHIAMRAILWMHRNG
jgi:hypothetical protein